MGLRKLGVQDKYFANETEYGDICTNGMYKKSIETIIAFSWFGIEKLHLSCVCPQPHAPKAHLLIHPLKF